MNTFAIYIAYMSANFFVILYCTKYTKKDLIFQILNRIICSVITVKLLVNWGTKSNLHLTNILLRTRFVQSKQQISLTKFCMIIYGKKKCLVMKISRFLESFLVMVWNRRFLELFLVMVWNMLLYIGIVTKILHGLDVS